MAIRLDSIPSAPPLPNLVGIVRWVMLLLVLWLVSVAWAWWHEGAAFLHQPGWALSVVFFPAFLWMFFFAIRLLFYAAQLFLADRLAQEREWRLAQLHRCGRRSQQVLAVSLHTALRPDDSDAGQVRQLDALLAGTGALKAQTAWSGASLRHSRLPAVDSATVEQRLSACMRRVLADLRDSVAMLPPGTPLALLLEIDTSVADEQVQALWQDAWVASDIANPVTRVEESGLAALDFWLDMRIRDPALLTIVAIQSCPEQPEGTAETAVGLLLGNRLTQDTLAPIAYLHRPEQARGGSVDQLSYAVNQALDWVPVEAPDITAAWRAGIDAGSEGLINTVMSRIAIPVKHQQGLYRLDAQLGHAGRASPWLAIAGAAQHAARGVGPQLVVSGQVDATSGLWGLVVMPVGEL